MRTELRFIVRALLRRRGYSAFCVTTLGLATGIALAAFALGDAALLRPVPLTAPDRVFTWLRSYEGIPEPGFLYPELERVLPLTDVFEALAGAGSLGVPVATETEARLGRVAFVTRGYFDAVGLRPALGRGFAAAEHGVGADPVVVATEAFWRTRLGGDAAVVGRTIRTGGRDAVIVGVMPRGFRGLEAEAPVDLFMPLMAAPLVAAPMNFFSDETAFMGDAGYSPNRWISITSRLSSGVNAEQAEAAVRAVLAVDSRGGSIELMPAARAAFPPRLRAEVPGFVGMLAMAAGLILAAGCANVAGMMLARQQLRRSEMAIRSWLGAGVVRVMRLLVAEAVLLASLGAAVGLGLAAWLGALAGSFVTLPGGVEVTWSAGGRLVALAVSAALVTGVLCGLPATLRSTDPHPPRSGRWRGLALAGQVAVLVVLTTGAGLFLRSLWAVAGADLGLDSGGLSYARVYFGGRGYDEHRVRGFYRDLVERLEARPGVGAVTFGNVPLLSHVLAIPNVEIGGEIRPIPAGVEVYFGGPEYVRTLGLGLVAGRDFGSRDGEGAPPVAVVTQSLARHLWGDREAVGERFTFLPLDHDVGVVGVLGDGRYGRRFDDLDRFAVFLPWAQNRRLGYRWGTIVARTNGDAGALAAAMRQEIRGLDRDLPIVEAGTFRDRLGALVRPQRLGAVFLSGLGGFALLITVAGVYGSVAQAMASRRRELGIRIALGAGRAAVVTTVLSNTLRYVGLGLVAGVAAATAFSALAEPHLLEVDPRDPAVYATVILIVMATSVLAALGAVLGVGREAPLNRLAQEVAVAE